MEWQVIFIQSLLIMLVPSLVTNACSCHMISWEDALCPQVDKTVVIATIISMEGLNHEGNVVAQGDRALNGRYSMRLDRTIKSGYYKLAVHNGEFTMMFPLDPSLCGLHLEIGRTYLIAGFVLSNDSNLYSNKCQLLLTQEAINDNILSLLNGKTAINCGNL